MRTFLLIVISAIAVKETSSFSVLPQTPGSRPSAIHTTAHQHNTRQRCFPPLNYQKSSSVSLETAKTPTSLKSAFVNETESYAIMMADPQEEDNSSSLLSFFRNSFWAPRILLAAVACVYGTNFSLGAVMEDSLPPSAATCARMVLAAAALSPFLSSLKKELFMPTVLAGCFTAAGYVTQSLALADTSPATVSFLGAATVLVCPVLQFLIDQKPLRWKDAPQTWIAAMLCLSGVGVLELWDSGGLDTTMHYGHVLALMQAVGFGTGMYMSSKLVEKHPNQALPITSVMVGVTAVVAIVWSCMDGWMLADDWQQSMPQLFLSTPSLTAAVLWTGLVSTSLNFFIEVTALGMVPSSEASVILATEPLWAALFASQWLHTTLGWNDAVGGVLIVMACLANTMEAEGVHGIIHKLQGKTVIEQQE